MTNEMLYRALGLSITIRTAENLIAKDFFDSKIFSFLHLSVGQEAAPVGICLALSPEDQILGNHRSHGHYLAKGGDLERMFYEIYGDTRGCCKGIGGSMHMLDRSVGMMGSTPILGSVIPIATGFAFKKAYMKESGIVVGFFGDGAAEEGYFYESVNLSCTLKLPVVYVIEDNRYAVATVHGTRKGPNFDYAKLMDGFGAIYERADGSDVESVYQKFVILRQRVLAEERPAVFHVDVLRHYAHSGPIRDDGAPYRGEDTVDFRNENDCLERLKRLLVERGEDTGKVAGFSESAAEKVALTFRKCRSTIKVR